MRNHLTLCVLGAVAVCAVRAVAVQAPDTPARIGTLAEYVPVEARLFLEVGDTAALGRAPAGEALGEVLAWLMAQVKSGEQVQPDTGKGWKQLFAGALGLQDQQVVELLLSGRMAVAADGMNELAAAVLVAEPTDPKRLEECLRRSAPVSVPGDRVRRYRLGRDQEIALGERVVVVGRRKSENDLYGRTLRLLGSERGLCLADLAEYRERLAEVPPGAQGFLYAGSNLRRGEESQEASPGWSLVGPQLKAAAVAILLTPQSLIVETAGRRVTSLASVPVPHDPPVDVLLFLPSSAVAAWSWPIDYVAELKRLRSANPQGPLPFYLGLLQLGMPADALDDGFKHLTGDTVFMIGRVSVRPRGELGERHELLMPTLALSVAVDDPEAVVAMLRGLSGNLLRLVNLPSIGESQVTLQSELLGENDESTRIHSVPLSTLLPTGPVRELLGSLEVSWTVADRRLVIGTHRETVRQIVLANRGEAPLMPADAIQQVMRRERSPRRLPDTMFVAQPGAAAEIIDSWLGYIQRNHPEMRKPEWWRQMRRQYGGSQVQLGIRPTPGDAAGAVVVAETMPNYPAHGRLLPGDQITAVDGRALDPARAMQSLRDALLTRARENRLTLTVVRQGKTMQIAIPMPASKSPADQVHPLTLLEQVSRLSKRFAFASYVTWQPSRELVQTRLELRLASAGPVPAVDLPGDEDASIGTTGSKHLAGRTAGRAASDIAAISPAVTEEAGSTPGMSRNSR